jgi:large subunit ribosomal protein L24
MYIKTNDLVQVVAGKDKGKTGKVVRIDRTAGKVIVEGINIVKRHKRPNAVDQQGGIVEKAAFISISNVMLYSEKLQRGVRVSYRYVGASGEYHASLKAAKDSFGTQAPERLKKVRMCLKTGEVF